MTTSGYCSPNGGCFPYALSPSLQLSGGPYSSYYINSNGVASFGSISGFLAAENVAGAVGQNSLSAFNVPVFSPYFSDEAAFQTLNAFDGNLVASTSPTGSGFMDVLATGAADQIAVIPGGLIDRLSLLELVAGQIERASPHHCDRAAEAILSDRLITNRTIA